MDEPSEKLTGAPYMFFQVGPVPLEPSTEWHAKQPPFFTSFRPTSLALGSTPLILR